MSRPLARLVAAMFVAGGIVGTALANQPRTRDLRSDPDAPIVVTGQRLTRPVARDRAAAFIRQVGIARGQESAARWVDPVCPRVLGIAEPYAGIVVARMRAIAAEAGMPVARERCHPNISVSFVGDAAALMQEISRRTPTRLQEVPIEARSALVEGDAPIRWWYLTDTRSRHNARSGAQSLPTEADGSAGGGSATSSSPIQSQGLSHYNSSMVSNQTNRAIIDANVVIDLDRVEGSSLEAVAAYAALVAFSEIRPSEPAPRESILALFDAQQGARSLTDWDMAFLRALYRMPLDRGARRHRGILIREMTDYQTGD